MAWRTDDGGRQFRKDASAAKRPEDNRAAMAEPALKHKRKHIPAIKRKFGIEHKYAGPDGGWLRLSREWRVCGWYEKERDRDNAIQALRKNVRPWFNYEYRIIDRE